MKIYIITSGEYDDYHICKVTDDPVSAEKFKKIYSGYDEAYIEEFDTEYMAEEPTPYWHFGFNLNSTLDRSSLHYFTNTLGEKPNEEVKIECHYFCVDVVEKNRDKAISIAKERIGRYITEHADEVNKAIAEKRSWDLYFAGIGMSYAASCAATFDNAESCFPKAEKLSDALKGMPNDK